MKTIILDIETTGDNYLIDEICQMSYLILDNEFNIIKAKNFFFLVDYVHFKSSKKKLNIEDLRVLSNNKKFKDNYDEIFNDLNNNFIIAHNSKHDIDFIKSEFIRANNKNKFEYKEFCTMKFYTNILKIESNKYEYKYPKLIEIMPYLNIKRNDMVIKSKEIFNLEEYEVDFHDSRVDVVVTYIISSKTNYIIEKSKELYNCNFISNSEVKNYNDNYTEKEYRNTNNIKDFENEKEMNLIQKLFSLKGRLGRSEYIIYRLICFLTYIIISYAYIYKSTYENGMLTTLFIISTLIHLWILLSIVIKRLHDIDKPGWYYILSWFPLINIWLECNLLFKKGISTKNNYGHKNKLNKKHLFSSLGISFTLIFVMIFTSSLGGNSESYTESDKDIEYLSENDNESNAISEDIEELSEDYLKYKKEFSEYFDDTFYDSDKRNNYTSKTIDFYIENIEKLQLEVDSYNDDTSGPEAHKKNYFKLEMLKNSRQTLEELKKTEKVENYFWENYGQDPDRGVYIVPNSGTKYHMSEYCEGLESDRDISKISLFESILREYKKCSYEY